MSEQTNDVKAKGTKKKATVEPKRVTRELEVKLDKDEIMARLEELLVASQTRDDLKAQKSEATSNINASIKLAEQKVKELNGALRNKREKREVECIERMIYATGTVEIVRADTNEIVEKRAMTLGERQENLPLAPVAPKSGEPLTATVGETVAAKATPDGERCTSELKGVRCTRPLKHRGAHGYKDDAPKA